jgi:amyloid beta precursor protein binding protein 1
VCGVLAEYFDVMKAQSADYVSLQNIYKTKARQDVEEVTATVRHLESQLQRGFDG